MVIHELGQVGQRFRVAVEGRGRPRPFWSIGYKKFAFNLQSLSRFVHYCPLLARKLENGLDTKIPRKSKKYEGFMWWPGTELNRRHGDFQYLASSYISGSYGDRCPKSVRFSKYFIWHNIPVEIN